MRRTAQRRLVSHHLVRLAIDWLHGTPSGLVATALVVGAGAGAGAVLFRNLIRWFTLLFTGHEEYSAAGHAPNPSLPAHPSWCDRSRTRKRHDAMTSLRTRIRSATLCIAAMLPLLAACGAATGGSSSSYHWTGASLQVALAKPEFTLTDQHGHAFDFRRDTAGKVTLLYFGYTHCPDVCPANMATLGFAVKQVPAATRRQIEVVFVTTDPRRDTLAVLAAWLNNFDASFIGLTGTKAEVDVAQAMARVSLASPEPAGQGGGYFVDHAAQIIVYTQDDLAHILFFEGMPASGIAGDLERLVMHGWQ